MKSVYIHIGLAKTGTSFLQSVFAYNADLYRTRGLSYPDLNNSFPVAATGGTTSGNALPIAAAGMPSLSQIKDSIALPDLLKRLDSDFNHLLSSEWLGGCSLDYLQNLERVLSQRFNVQFLAVVRDPRDHIVSSYQQGLKASLFKYSLATHANEIINRMRLSLRLIIDLGRSIQVISYDVNKHCLVSRFDQVLFGQDISISPPFRRVNPSPDVRQTAVLQIASCLGISNQSMAQRYIEQTQESDQARYRLANHLSERVLRELEWEISEINKLLPEDETIQRQEDESAPNSIEILRDADIDFLSEVILKRIASEKKDDIDFIVKWANQAHLVEQVELPEGFNVISYLVFNPDLVAARVNPIQHYLTHGATEGRRYK
jgi:hypothetical protein